MVYGFNRNGQWQLIVVGWIVRLVSFGAFAIIQLFLIIGQKQFVELRFIGSDE